MLKALLFLLAAAALSATAIALVRRSQPRPASLGVWRQS
jgi:hypothetical protein